MATRSRTQAAVCASEPPSSSPELFPEMNSFVEAHDVGSSEVSPGGSGSLSTDSTNTILPCAQPSAAQGHSFPSESGTHHSVSSSSSSPSSSSSSPPASCDLPVVLRRVRARHHVQFLDVCLQEQLIPKGLKLTLPLTVVAPECSDLHAIVDSLLHEASLNVMRAVRNHYLAVEYQSSALGRARSPDSTTREGRVVARHVRRLVQRRDRKLEALRHPPTPRRRLRRPRRRPVETTTSTLESSSSDTLPLNRVVPERPPQRRLTPASSDSSQVARLPRRPVVAITRLPSAVHHSVRRPPPSVPPRVAAPPAPPSPPPNPGAFHLRPRSKVVTPPLPPRPNPPPPPRRPSLRRPPLLPAPPCPLPPFPLPPPFLHPPRQLRFLPPPPQVLAPPHVQPLLTAIESLQDVLTRTVQDLSRAQ